MNSDTKLFVLGLTSSFAAGLVLVYLYSKWNQKEVTPLLSIYESMYRLQ